VKANRPYATLLLQRSLSRWRTSDCLSLPMLRACLSGADHRPRRAPSPS
jgi:hypothetical protein